MSLTQQLTVNEGQGFAQLVIRSDAEGIQDLADLAQEISDRPGVTTNGPIVYTPPPEPPPM